MISGAVLRIGEAETAGHSANPLMARRVPAGSFGIMSTLLERGVGRAGVLLRGWAPVLLFSVGGRPRYPATARLPFTAGGTPASRAIWRRRVSVNGESAATPMGGRPARSAASTAVMCCSFAASSADWARRNRCAVALTASSCSSITETIP